MTKIIKSVVIFFIVLTNISCTEKNERSEKLLGIKVGDSKEQVINDLISNVNVTYIKPDLDNHFELNKNSKNLSTSLREVTNQLGVVIVRKSPKLHIRIVFTGNYMSSIYLAPVNQGEDLGLKVGMEKRNAGKILIDNLINKKIDRIFNFMPQADWIEIQSMSNEQYLYLLLNDTWSFGENHKHSAIKLHFIDGLLSSIDYKWSPLELP